LKDERKEGSRAGRYTFSVETAACEMRNLDVLCPLVKDFWCKRDDCYADRWFILSVQ